MRSPGPCFLDWIRALTPSKQGIAYVFLGHDNLVQHLPVSLQLDLDTLLAISPHLPSPHLKVSSMKSLVQCRLQHLSSSSRVINVFTGTGH